VGTPAPDSIEELTRKVHDHERWLRDHEQRFDTLQTPLWKRVLFWFQGWPYYDLNGTRSEKPWYRRFRRG
jgi:hypothetical protein